MHHCMLRCKQHSSTTKLCMNGKSYANRIKANVVSQDIHIHDIHNKNMKIVLISFSRRLTVFFGLGHPRGCLEMHEESAVVSGIEVHWRWWWFSHTTCGHDRQERIWEAMESKRKSCQALHEILRYLLIEGLHVLPMLKQFHVHHYPALVLEGTWSRGSRRSKSPG